MAPKATSQKTNSSGCQRARAATLSWARAMREREAVMALRSFRCAAAGEQTLRSPDQHHEHDRVDHEGAELGHIIFAGDVADTEQQRGEERPGDARGAADGDHDQEVDHVFKRKRWIE